MAEQTNLKSAQNIPLPERTVTFPEDFSMGTLYLRNWDEEEDLPFFDQGIWKRLGPARGKTTVPAGQKLGLWVKADDKKNFAVLAKLDQNDLQGLQISGLDTNNIRLITHLTGLQYLFIYNSPQLGDDGLMSLSKLSSLGFLFLSGCSKLDTGLAVLKEMPSLYDMELENIELTGRAIRDLSHIPSLDGFCLTEMPMGDTDFIANFTVSSVAGILFSGCKNLTDATLAHIAQLSKDAPKPLVGFQVCNMAVSEAGIESVLKSMPKDEVVELGFPHTSATERLLPQIAGMINLGYIDLSGLPITDAGVEYLESLPKLKWLYLRKTQISDDCIGSLVKLKRLQILNLRETAISQTTIEQLRAALPECEILHEGQIDPLPNGIDLNDVTR